eukprot:scaffold345_cov134-Cylindrotheca_fusiformis.AAC.64
MTIDETSVPFPVDSFRVRVPLNMPSEEFYLLATLCKQVSIYEQTDLDISEDGTGKTNELQGAAMLPLRRVPSAARGINYNRGHVTVGTDLIGPLWANVTLAIVGRTLGMPP